MALILGSHHRLKLGLDVVWLHDWQFIIRRHRRLATDCDGDGRPVAAAAPSFLR